tara:strand:+ start:16090 stop:16230 length:141 start_codon:yes stop_codon:yes gene_type:complete
VGELELGTPGFLEEEELGSYRPYLWGNLPDTSREIHVGKTERFPVG